MIKPSLTKIGIMLLISCSVVQTGCITPYRPSEAAILDAKFSAEVKPRIALLPPRFSLGSSSGIESGSELSLGRMIVEKLRKRVPQVWVSPEDAVSLIQDANVLPEYEALLDGFQKTGIASKARLAKIGTAVNCPYIALCNLNYSQETSPRWIGVFRYGRVTIQVLSVATGAVVFEGIGKGETGPGYGSRDMGTNYVFRLAASDVISQLPGSHDEDEAR